MNKAIRLISKEVFTELDHKVYKKLKHWGKRRHPNKSGNWTANRYWQTIGDNNWVFATKQESKNPLRLLKHSDTEVKSGEYVKVKSDASPYDGNLVYWSTRMGKNPEMPKTVTTLLKKQKGKCTHCGLYFTEDSVMEVDHVIPKSKGGKNSYNNLQLLHRHCHDEKTKNDKSLGNKSDCNSVKPKPVKTSNRGINDNDLITEEPCDGKLSSMVLKTSGSREGITQFNKKLKGSANREQSRKNLVRRYEDISNRRRDWFWKLAHELTDKFDVLCFETLNLKGMQRLWGRKISDLAFGEFLQILEWVAKKKHKQVVFVDQWYPSSQTCSHCGHILESLDLSVREWRCPSCQSVNGRDENAARNIQMVGASTIGLGDVRLATPAIAI